MKWRCSAIVALSWLLLWNGPGTPVGAEDEPSDRPYSGDLFSRSTLTGDWLGSRNDLAARGDKQGYRVLGVAVEDTRAAVTEYSKEANLLFPTCLSQNEE